MKKIKFFVLLFSVFFTQTYSFFSCSNIVNKNSEKEIEVINESSNGRISLDKYKGKISEEISGFIEAKSGYKLEYLIFNNEFVEVSDDNSFKIIVSSNNVLKGDFVRISNESLGVISFLNRNKEPSEEIKNYNDALLIDNIALDSINLNNAFYTSDDRLIQLGNKENSGEIIVNFNSIKYIKNISINAKYALTSNISPIINISYSSTDSTFLKFNSESLVTKQHKTSVSKTSKTLKLSVDPNNSIIINKIYIEFGEKNEVETIGIINKFNGEINVKVNRRIDVLDFCLFKPYNAIDKEIRIECSDKDLIIENNFITSKVEKPYEISVILASNPNINVKFNVKFSLNMMDEGVFKISKNDNMEDIYSYKKQIGLNTLPTTGDYKLLVVPIQFSDLVSYNETRLKQIDECFNSKKPTYFESLSSYYSKSSYNKLNLSFDLTDVCIPSMTSTEYLRKQDNYAGETFYLIKDIYEKLTIKGKKLTSLIDEYDHDKDGNIDGMYFVINEFNLENINQNRFWAYTYWYYNTGIGLFDKNIKIGTFVSYGAGFNYKRGEGNDAHTIIHETGHMLGSEDYYSYDGVISSLGGIDMMDYNIGDHNSFNKYFYNWLEPLIVDVKYLNEPIKIALKPLNSSPSCLIIPSLSFNNNPFGEYLIIEYYTPQNLNKFDNEHIYDRLCTFSSNGIKILHINSRMMKYGKTTTSLAESNEYYFDKNSTYMFAYSNTLNNSYNKSIPLIELVSKRNTLLSNNRYANDTDLFTENDKFNSNIYTSYFKNNKFDDGSNLNIQIKVESLSDEEAILEISKTIS